MIEGGGKKKKDSREGPGKDFDFFRLLVAKVKRKPRAEVAGEGFRGLHSALPRLVFFYFTAT